MSDLNELRTAVAAYLEPAKCPKLDAKLAIAVIEAAIKACESPRLTPDRERVAKHLAAMNEHEEDAPFVWREYLPQADAAIAAMGEP